MAGSVVALSPPRRFAFDGYQVWHDPSHHHLVLMRQNLYFSLPLPFGSGAGSGGDPELQLSRPINFVHPGPCLAVRFSLDRGLLAIQRSATEVEVVDLGSAVQWTVACRAKGGNELLRDGIVWSDHGGTSQDLILVTKMGLEFFKVSTKKRTCKHYRNVSHRTAMHWYSPDQRLLVLATPAREMRGYQLVTSTSELPKFEIPAPHRLAKFDAPVERSGDAALLRLYGQLFFVAFERSRCELAFYALAREGTARRVRAFALDVSDDVQLHSVDNVVVVYSPATAMCFLFDLMQASVHPLVSPLPLGEPGEIPLDDASLQSSLFAGGLAPVAEAEGQQQPGEEPGSSPEDPAEGDGDSSDDGERFFDAREDEEDEDGPEDEEDDDDGEWVVRESQHSQQSAEDAVPDRARSSSVNRRIDPRHRFTLLGPAWALSFDEGLVCTLQLQLGNIAACTSDVHELLPFLMRRGAAPRPSPAALDDPVAPDPGAIAYARARHPERVRGKALVLKKIADLVAEGATLPLLSAVFANLSEVFKFAARDRAETQLRLGRRSSSMFLQEDALIEEAVLGGSTSSDDGDGDGDGVDAGDAAGGRAETQPEEAKKAEDDDDDDNDPGVDDAVVEAADRASLAREHFDMARAAASSTSTRQRPAPPALQDIRNSRGQAVVSQLDIFFRVLVPAAHSERVPAGYVTNLTAEYLRSLRRFRLPVQPYLHQFLVDQMVDAGNLQGLYQCLQYHVLTDSVSLAARVLDVAHEYPPLRQLSLDMLSRLGEDKLVVEELLEDCQLFAAIRLIRRKPDKFPPHSVSAHKFMAAAVHLARQPGAQYECGGAASLLHLVHAFLAEWDPSCLAASGAMSSPLSSMVPFPDDVLDAATAQRLRAAFGYRPSAAPADLEGDRVDL